jgi:serine/threonine-protein kinase RsbW
MITKSYYPVVFNRTIYSTKTESYYLIDEALQFLSELQKRGLAANISELDFRLVLDEAVENAIQHGNCFDPEKKVSVTIRAIKRKIEMTIVDEGTGFNPDEVPNPNDENNIYILHGRGLYIIRKIGHVRWNKRGNRIFIKLNR